MSNHALAIRENVSYEQFMETVREEIELISDQEYGEQLEMMNAQADDDFFGLIDEQTLEQMYQEAAPAAVVVEAETMEESKDPFHEKAYVEERITFRREIGEAYEKRLKEDARQNETEKVTWESGSGAAGARSWTSQTSSGNSYTASSTVSSTNTTTTVGPGKEKPSAYENVSRVNEKLLNITQNIKRPPRIRPDKPYSWKKMKLKEKLLWYWENYSDIKRYTKVGAFLGLQLAIAIAIGKYKYEGATKFLTLVGVYLGIFMLGEEMKLMNIDMRGVGIL